MTLATKILRPDIQALRAIAVISVVSYHIGWPISGGFLGVDIFFAISGYVITKSVFSKANEEEHFFKWFQFLTKRFFRLAPALALVVTFTAIFSSLLQSPLGPQQNTASTGLGAMFGVSNFVLQREAGPYFDSRAESNPLLNTWSLGVEEQFYILFAIVLLLIFYFCRNGKSRTFAFKFAMSALTVFSLTYMFLIFGGHYILKQELLYGFYSPLPRIWEFSAGALVASLSFGKIFKGKFFTYKLVFVFTIFFYFVLIFSLIFFEEKFSSPSPLVIVPIVSTLMILILGESGKEFMKNSRNLNFAKPLISIGNYSYSLYLWHWPFIVFGVLIFGLGAAPIAAMLSIAPAIASYRLVEQPLRGYWSKNKKDKLKAATLVFLPAVLACSVLLISSVNSWWNPTIQSINNSVNLEPKGWTNCLSRGTLNEGATDTNPSYSSCGWNTQASGVPIYLVGDSQAAHLSDGLIRAAGITGRPLYMRTAAGCPLSDIYREGENKIKSLCREFYETTLNFLTEAKPGTVIIASTAYYWSDNVLPGEDVYLVTSDNAMTEGLSNTVNKLSATQRNIILVKPIPLPSVPPLNCGLIRLIVDSESCYPKSRINDYLTYSDKASDGLIDISNRNSSITLLDFKDEFCDKDWCFTVENGTPIYRDGFHMSVAKSIQLSSIFVGLLK